MPRPEYPDQLTAGHVGLDERIGKKVTHVLTVEHERLQRVLRRAHRETGRWVADVRGVTDHVFGVTDDQPHRHHLAGDRILVGARNVATCAGGAFHLLFHGQIRSVPIADVHGDIFEQLGEFLFRHRRALKAVRHLGFGHRESDEGHHAEYNGDLTHHGSNTSGDKYATRAEEFEPFHGRLMPGGCQANEAALADGRRQGPHNRYFGARRCYKR